MQKSITVLLILYLGVLFYLTLASGTEKPRDEGKLNLIPFYMITAPFRSGGRRLLLNVLGNLVLFMPLGFLVPLARDKPIAARQVALLSGAISLLIEILQFGSGNRVADVDDIIMNTVSGLLGYYALVAIRRVRGLPSHSFSPGGLEAGE